MMTSSCLRHSVPGWGDSFEIFVPRKNKVLPVPQAPPRLLAFLEAFRRANEGCWEGIAKKLKGMLEEKPDDLPRPSSCFFTYLTLR